MQRVYSSEFMSGCEATFEHDRMYRVPALEKETIWTKRKGNDMNEEECVCEYEGLECGDTLYIESSWDGGIEFRHIRNIKYCPVCGKKLPGENQ